jgi:glc operon protein GlcG
MKALRQSWCAIAALFLTLVLGRTVFAQAPAPALPAQPISLAESRAIIDGAIAAAREKNARIGVVVLDSASSEMVAGEHMDGAPGRNIMFAQGKAFASITYRTTSEALSGLYKTRPDRYFGILNMYGNKIYLVGGGIPLVVDGKLVGAVGVAGSNQDELFAQAGVTAWEKVRADLRK